MRKRKRSGSCHCSCQMQVSPQAKSLKPLVDSLDLWWDSKEIFDMPKGGYGSACLPLFSDILSPPVF